MEGFALAALDVVLVTMLVALAWGAIESRDLTRGVVLFIAFGLVLALTWARLAAPDVALAEAAIGAGLSGALLIAALRDGWPESAPRPRDGTTARAATWLVGALTVALAFTVAWALTAALGVADASRLADEVAAALAASGVSNPVTAILLNFRAYDTLLELAVLLTALLGILAAGAERDGYGAAGPVLDGLTRTLVPLLLIAGGYLLWVGAHAPGGAFQAGAVLAGAAVMLRLSGRRRAGLPEGITLRLVVVAGVAVFLAVGLAQMLGGRPFLGYPSDAAGGLILLIETAATLAIAATLALAFIGGRPVGWRQPPAAPRRARADVPGPESDPT